MVDCDPRPSPLILAWICLIQVPVLVASPGVSPFFFQLEFSLELVSMYSICIDITTNIANARVAHVLCKPAQAQVARAITVLCELSSMHFHIALLQPV